MRYSVIIAGGSGTRLWPLSRLGEPKQLLPLINGRSLLEIAGDRLEGTVDRERRLVCAAEVHRERIRAALPWLSDDRFLGEPEGRDTLNAVGFAAAIAANEHANAMLAVLTADHLIEPQAEFARALDLGFRLVEAQPNRFVTFGITPTFAATGYGWVEQGAPIEIDRVADSSGGSDAPRREARTGSARASGATKATNFVEKPERARAEEFLASRKHLWNSGMFVFHAATLLRAIEWFRPESATGLREIAAASKTPRRKEVLSRVYPTLPKVSVDVGVMEPASRDARLEIAVVPMDVKWRDVGSWSSLAATLPADADANRTNGAQSAHLDSRRVTVVGDDPSHLVATIGCEDLVIVCTKDATLVCRAADAERVKELASRVPESKR